MTKLIKKINDLINTGKLIEALELLDTIDFNNYPGMLYNLKIIECLDHLYYYKKLDNKKLTIAISTYNRSAWIDRGLRYLIDICTQFSDYVDIVICDNCSTDDTEIIVRNIMLTKATKESNLSIKYIRNITNVGMLGNLAVTANNCEGDYFLILGDDDLLQPNSIGKFLLKITLFDNVDLIYLNYSISWAAKPLDSTVENYIRDGHQISYSERDLFDSAVNVSVENENFFTAIYALIFRNDHGKRCYNQDTSGEPFTSLQSCIPTTKYILNELSLKKIVWISKSCLVVNPQVSWVQHLNLWFINICPLKYQKFIEAGASQDRVDYIRKSRISGIVKYTKQSFMHGGKNLQHLDFVYLIRTFIHLIEFKIVLPTLLGYVMRKRFLLTSTNDSLIALYKSLNVIPSLHQYSNCIFFTPASEKCGVATYGTKLYSAIKLKMSSSKFTYSAAEAPDSFAKFDVNLSYSQLTKDFNKNIIRSLVKCDLVVINLHTNYLNTRGLFLFISKLIDCKNIKIIKIIIHNGKSFIDALHDKIDLYLSLPSERFRFLFHSENDINYFLSRYPQLGESIEIFIHPIDDRQTSSVRNARNVADFTISSFGFLLPHKNYDILLKAFSLILKIYPNAKLNILSARIDSRSDLPMESIFNLITKHNMHEEVTFVTEFLDDDQIYQYLSRSTMICFPYSDSNESASGAVRHALPLGIPTVVSNTAIFQEFGESVEKLESFDPEKIALQLIQLYLDKPRLLELADSARKYSLRHSWNEMVISVCSDVNHYSEVEPENF
jgi:glycosyltransferase involved in cell wall biosynthesis